MALAVPPLRELFDRPAPATIGLEEEVMLLDPATLDLAHRAGEVLAGLDGDGRFAPELPTSQIELITPPAPDSAAAITALAAARRDLAASLDGRLRLAAAGVHPFAAVEGPLHSGGRYDRVLREFGRLARRQLVCALQVHVCVRGADRALAVHNALRGLLPEIAALAANAPFYAGEDTGLATVRPKICDLLPRHGVPAPIASWEAHEAALAQVGDPAVWWWAIRPHVVHGTLEVRVPDAQPSVADAAGVAVFTRALAVWLAERFDAGERLPVAETWRIEENRWSACRWGVAGELVDLETGERQPARARIGALLDELVPTAARLGEDLAPAWALLERPGSDRRRADARHGGVRAVAEGLAEAFLASP